MKWVDVDRFYQLKDLLEALRPGMVSASRNYLDTMVQHHLQIGCNCRKPIYRHLLSFIPFYRSLLYRGVESTYTIEKGITHHSAATPSHPLPLQLPVSQARIVKGKKKGEKAEPVSQGMDDDSGELR